jgi:hypothetical protein
MAFTYTWTEVAPTDDTYAHTIDDEIRKSRAMVRERLAVDHNFFEDEDGESEVGVHKQVTLLEKEAAPDAATAGIQLYDLAGVLYFRRKTGNPVKVLDETDETITGVKTFASLPLLPTDDPTEDNHPVSKSYAQTLINAGIGSVMIVADEKGVGTGGGTFTSGAWRTRDLNTERYNGITGASLAANRITLPAGTYRVWANAPAGIRAWSSGETTYWKARLYNITADEEIPYCASESGYRYAKDDDRYNVRTIIVGVFTLTVESVIELQHYTTRDQDFGRAASIDSKVEVYAQIELHKIA